MYLRTYFDAVLPIFTKELSKMKIVIEMIFYIGGDNTMCFSEPNVPYRYDPVEVAYHVVVNKRREFSLDSKLISVKIGDKDVTDEVKAFEKEYLRRLDDEIPF